MSRLVWFFAWATVAIWSLFCAAAYGVFNLAGGWFARNADLFASDPQTVEWIYRVFSGLQTLSTSAVMVGWGAVSLLVLAVPWLLDRLAGPAPRGAPASPPATGWTPPRQDGVIDLSPDQYSVGPQAGTRPASPTPRIPPRR